MISRIPENRRVILASSSPRRASILKMMGVKFEAMHPEIKEIRNDNEPSSAFALRMAEEKAYTVAELISEGLIISADTIVVLDSIMLGKPIDINEAREMLKMLSGETHTVITAVCLYDREYEKILTRLSKTDVTFYPIEDNEIESYIQTEEPYDKAGAYAAQGFGSIFIESVNGSYSNVVGLPSGLLNQMIKEFFNVAVVDKEAI